MITNRLNTSPVGNWAGSLKAQTAIVEIGRLNPTSNPLSKLTTQGPNTDQGPISHLAIQSLLPIGDRIQPSSRSLENLFVSINPGIRS